MGKKFMKYSEVKDERLREMIKKKIMEDRSARSNLHISRWADKERTIK